MKNKTLIKMLILAISSLILIACEEEYYDTKNAGEDFLAEIAKKGTVDLYNTTIDTLKMDITIKTVKTQDGLRDTVVRDTVYTIAERDTLWKSGVEIRKLPGKSGIYYAEYWDNEYGEFLNAVSVGYVWINYRACFINGQVLDKGTRAQLDYRNLVPGFQEALRNMRKGAKWRIWVPYQYAYGSEGNDGSVDPYTALIFDIELIDF
ncbi:MAG: FKBP-type peptidyl-prolyl cis-trans isomerase [Prevotellaceae bacterium]|jgi:hypothetical protein|nr:FKBP-type peptidyl-prolyl cis-trans isomerase [Prevotellaceae bacterium]